MRIVFVLEHYHPYIGGAERLFQLLAESLAAEGHEVNVLTTRFRQSLPPTEQYQGVNIIRINCVNRYLFSFLSLPKVIRYARKADILHTTTYNAALPAWLAARLTRKKVIVTFHEVWGNLWFRLPFASRLQKTGYHLFEKLLLKLSFDQYIAVSNFTQTALQAHGIPGNRIQRIYNGLHYEQFDNFQHQTPSTFTYTYFGRLGISKGLNLLLPAAKLFSQQHPQSQLVLIIPRQPTAIYQKVLQLIEDLEIQQHVLIRHELSRTDLCEQISRSSCVVIPSYSEGFCFVAAETVAMGVPIISSGQGALKEVVSGPMIEMEQMDSQSLFQALQKAHSGEWIKRPKNRFTMNDSLQAYLELYARL